MAKLKTGRHTSAIKALRQARRRTQRNWVVKSEMRTLTKQIQELIKSKKKDEANQLLPKLVASWYKAGHKRVVHPNLASRKISRISKAIHNLAHS